MTGGCRMGGCRRVDAGRRVDPDGTRCSTPSPGWSTLLPQHHPAVRRKRLVLQWIRYVNRPGAGPPPRESGGGVKMAADWTSGPSWIRTSPGLLLVRSSMV